MAFAACCSWWSRIAAPCSANKAGRILAGIAFLQQRCQYGLNLVDT